jgi:hypothetical protein
MIVPMRYRLAIARRTAAAVDCVMSWQTALEDLLFKEALRRSDELSIIELALVVNGLPGGRYQAEFRAALHARAPGVTTGERANE